MICFFLQHFRGCFGNLTMCVPTCNFSSSKSTVQDDDDVTFCFLLWCEIWSTSDWYQQGLSWSVSPAPHPEYSPCTLGVSRPSYQDIACDFNPFCTLCTPRGSIWHVANVSATELSMLSHLVTDIKICTLGCSSIQNCGPDSPHPS